MEYKISDTHWLCVKDTRGNWTPVFKLTQDQIDNLTQFFEGFIKQLSKI